MNIISPTLENEHLIQQAAQLLTDAFREHWPDAWPTFEEGLKELMFIRSMVIIICIALMEEKMEYK